jgi:hypothetical protein
MSLHRQPKSFIKWLKTNVPEKYRWFQENKRLEHRLVADYKEAFLTLSQKNKSQFK